MYVVDNKSNCNSNKSYSNCNSNKSNSKSNNNNNKSHKSYVYPLLKYRRDAGQTTRVHWNHSESHRLLGSNGNDAWPPPRSKGFCRDAIGALLCGRVSSIPPQLLCDWHPTDRSSILGASIRRLWMECLLMSIYV